MCPRTSKIDFSDLVLGGFDPKITIPTSIRVGSLTFDQLLKIFGNKTQTHVANHIFSTIAQQLF